MKRRVVLLLSDNTALALTRVAYKERISRSELAETLLANALNAKGDSENDKEKRRSGKRS